MLALWLLADLIYVQSGEGLAWFAVEAGVPTLKGRLATPGQSPYYLRADGRRLYAAAKDRLLTFSIGADGALTRGVELPSPGGPCYVDARAGWAATANYGAGETRLYPAEGEARVFPTGPQTHSARFHGRYLYALSVGGRKITRVRVEDGELWTLDMPELGPRHIAFSERFAFVVHERPIRVSSLKLDVETGRLSPVGDWPALAAGMSEKKELAAAEIAVSGALVVASVRDFSKAADQNGLAVFAAHPESGALSFVEFVASGGTSPRGFVIDPKGEYLYVLNEIQGTLKVFRIVEGRLKGVGEPLKVGGPSIGIAYVAESK